MSTSSEWHADPESLARYVAGTLPRASAASIEAHLVTCARCRTDLRQHVSVQRVDRGLAELLDDVDRRRAAPVERALRWLGVPEHLARIFTVTPAARTAWLTGIAAATVTAAAADAYASPGRTMFVLLVLAPLLPLVGVTAAFGSRGDPARELVTVTPMPGFELAMLRALAVLVPTVVVASAVAVALPSRGWEPVLWLLPSAGLVSATLALGTWLPVRPVAWALGSTWVIGAGVAVHGAAARVQVDDYLAFRPAGQAVLLAVTLVAGVAVSHRRDTFDGGQSWRIS